ncbi:ABC transporter ATP-binding protein [Rhodospirillaceae bacterium SYSU D60014]|uniref:ABC transporter ATP-binding protein n=1 Tax=Virgifigura deserti TaxID=2268457 RepID=UPI000E66E6C8
MTNKATSVSPLHPDPVSRPIEEAGPARTAVELDRVGKIYGHGTTAVEALHEISFDIRDNEFFTLLGPSGCGKTTLLRTLAGFEHVTRGVIRLFGQDIVDVPTHKRPVNTVFQHYSLFPHMTVADNVAYGLRRLKKPADEIRGTVDEMLRLVKMERFADRLPAQLSGGQQQRVALARALAPSPKVLLLDEPLSALDLKLRQAMRQELKQIQARTGITFIFVTHDQDEALSMSDRIAVMSEGHLQQVGTPTEIYEHPVNRFVAGFVGDANFIEAEIASPIGAKVTCRTRGGLELQADATKASSGQRDAVLFLRPEKVRLTEPGAGTVNGTVRDIQYLGNSTLMEIDIGEPASVIVRQSGDVNQPACRPGDTVGVVLDPHALQVLAE